MKAFRILSERAPDLVYPQFALFAGLLGAESRILKWNAMLIVGNMRGGSRAETRPNA